MVVVPLIVAGFNVYIMLFLTNNSAYLVINLYEEGFISL